MSCSDLTVHDLMTGSSPALTWPAQVARWPLLGTPGVRRDASWIPPRLRRVVADNLSATTRSASSPYACPAALEKFRHDLLRPPQQASRALRQRPQGKWLSIILS